MTNVVRTTAHSDTVRALISEADNSDALGRRVWWRRRITRHQGELPFSELYVSLNPGEIRITPPDSPRDVRPPLSYRALFCDCRESGVRFVR